WPQRLLGGSPRVLGDEGEAELRDRRPGKVEHLPDDRPEQDDRRQRGGERDPAQPDVAHTIPEPAPGGAQRIRRRNGAQRSRTLDAPYERATARHQPVTTTSPSGRPPVMGAEACSPQMNSTNQAKGM